MTDDPAGRSAGKRSVKKPSVKPASHPASNLAPDQTNTPLSDPGTRPTGQPSANPDPHRFRNLGLLCTDGDADLPRLRAAVALLAALQARYGGFRLGICGITPADIRDRALWWRINSAPELRHAIGFAPPGADPGLWMAGIGHLLLPGARGDNGNPDIGSGTTAGSSIDPSIDGAAGDGIGAAIRQAITSGAIPAIWPDAVDAALCPWLLRPQTPDMIARQIGMLAGSCSLARQIAQLRDAPHSTAPPAVFDMAPSMAPDMASDMPAGRPPDMATPAPPVIASPATASAIPPGGAAPVPAVTAVDHGPEVRRVLVVWGIADWEDFHRREMLTALAGTMAADERLLYIDPHNHFATLLRLDPAGEARLRREAGLHPRWPHPRVAALRLLNGTMPATVESHPLLSAGLGRGALAEAAAQALFGEGIRVTHWLYKPEQFAFMPPAADILYEVYDDYTRDFGTGVLLPTVAALETACLAQARHVFFTSEVLAARKSAPTRGFDTITNGVDHAAFAAPRAAVSPAPPQSTPVPVTAPPGLSGAVVPRTTTGAVTDTRHPVRNRPISNGITADVAEGHEAGTDCEIGTGIGRPLIGYLGNLSDFFDWELMESLCRDMPGADFLFCGGIERNRLGPRADIVTRMEDLSNVLFTGRVTRPAGAAAMARCDALVIPFRVNPAMDAVNPLKLWEYFALGLPVVSSPMETVAIAAPLLRIATTAGEWHEALTAALTETDPSLAARRIAMAQARDWHRLVPRHLEVIRAG